MNLKLPVIGPNATLYKQEGSAGIYQIILPYLAAGKGMKHYLPMTLGESWALFKRNYIINIFYEQNFEKLSSFILSETKGIFPSEWEAKWKEIDLSLTNESRKLVDVDIESMDLSALKNVYDRLFQLHQDMWDISIFIDVFDTGSDQKEIARIAESYGLSSEMAQVLVTPQFPAFVTEWELSLNAYTKGTLTKEALKEGFFWYATDYAEFGELTDSFIEKGIASIHSSQFISPAKEEEEILLRFKLTSNPLEFFRTITTWRDNRKRLNYIGLYGLIKILREVARRNNIDPDLVTSLLPSEVPSFFENTLLSVSFEAREENGVLLHVTADENFEYVLDKEEIEKNWNAISSLFSTQAQAQELKGTVASKGKATGRVKVIKRHNDPNAAFFEKGDILVTSMTRPEFLPLMKLAAAIVTDEGGITSHAAIVSRELGIPCIIGVRVAAQVLKDGDMVEVDAERGVVTKL